MRSTQRGKIIAKMAASGFSIVAIFVVLVLLQLAVGGNAASLEIWPNGDVQSKPIGSSLILTCQPNVNGQDVISDIRWLDPENRTIETRSAAAAAGSNANPPISTEMHQPNSLKLYIYSLKENQAGRYTCVAKYAATETLQKSVMIETIEAIKWIDAPENQYPILGKEFKIKCHVSARPSPTVDWLHDGNLITTNDHYIIETHALKIKKVVESDEGIYTCRASVEMTGELQDRAIRVEVLEEPKIDETNTVIEIVEDRTETIACKATGKPSPKYTWVKYLTREDLSKTDRFGVDADTGLLTIVNVNRVDDGEYQCTAKNIAGEAQTIVKVAVIGKPKKIQFTNVTTVIGKTIELACTAFGRPTPDVFFRKHTSNEAYKHGVQPDDDRITLKTVASDDVARGETTAVLRIENILRQDDGLYECIAKNKVATSYKNGHLTVQYPPSFATMSNNTVWSWERRTVNLTCIAESIPNATIQWYINGERPVDLNDPMYRQIGKGPVSTLVVKPVDRRYYANYKCRASNEHGTREHIIELKEAERPAHVQQARMSEITATTISFVIVPPATQTELPLRTVSAQYKEMGMPWTSARNKTWSIGSPYVIEGLKPQTQYDFRFSARNDVGDGNWGANIAETTPQRNIPNPPRIQVRSSESAYEISPFNNQYQLQWYAPPDNGEPIDLYEIRYCQVKRAGNEWELLKGSCVANEMKGQRTQQWLKDLNSDSFYRAEVRAHNVIGFSNPGISHFKTARESSGGTVDYGMINAGDVSKSLAITIAATIAIIFLDI